MGHRSHQKRPKSQVRNPGSAAQEASRGPSRGGGGPSRWWQLEMGSISGLWGGSKGSLGGKMVQRRPGSGEKVLGSSSDSDTHGCVTCRSLLNLSEPQILRLIWELEGTIPRQGCSVIHCNEPSVRTVPGTLGACGGQTLSLSAWGSRGQTEEDPGRGSVGPRLLPGLRL